MSKVTDKLVPVRGELMINPLTGRPIKVGGSTWCKLARRGEVPNRYVDDREVEMPDDWEDLTEPAKKKRLREMSAEMPIGTSVVKGRGRYEGKLVKRYLKPKSHETSRHTAKVAGKVVKQHMDSLSDMDDMEGELERLIMEELANTPLVKPKPKPKRGRGRPRLNPKKYEEPETEVPETSAYETDMPASDYETDMPGDGDDSESESETETIDDTSGGDITESARELAFYVTEDDDDVSDTDLPNFDETTADETIAGLTTDMDLDDDGGY